MKIAAGAVAALLLAGIGWSLPAQAQGVPRGSYLRSCTDVVVQGGSLVATCRRGDGLEQRTALPGVRRCVGDIGNNHGVLQCNYGGGAQVRGLIVGEPGHLPGPPPVPPPAYGAPPYGGPPPGYAAERWERCRGLHRTAAELRARLDQEWHPRERARLERQLRAVHWQERRCRD